MPAVGFEPTIPVSERPQTHVLDRAATEIGFKPIIVRNYRSVAPLSVFMTAERATAS
jgi:hypothetical protein